MSASPFCCCYVRDVNLRKVFKVSYPGISPPMGHLGLLFFFVNRLPICPTLIHILVCSFSNNGVPHGVGWMVAFINSLFSKNDLDHGFTFVRDLAHFEVWRSREQHVADSSYHSLYLIKLFNSSDPEGNKLSGMSRTICPSVSSRDSTKMCTHQAQFTIFWGPDMFALTRCAVYVRCVGMCSVFVVCYWCFVSVFGCVCRCASLCVVVCVWKITVNIFILMCMSVSLFLLVFSWQENAVWNTYFPWCLLFEAFHLPQWFQCFFFSLLFPALF